MKNEKKETIIQCHEKINWQNEKELSHTSPADTWMIWGVKANPAELLIHSPDWETEKGTWFVQEDDEITYEIKYDWWF